MLTVVPGDGSGHESGNDRAPSLIDEIVREGARRMLAEALQAEVDAYIVAHAAERDENGRRLVVRNGCHQPREILTSAGAVEVMVPRVSDKRTDPDTGERKRFSSAIVPPWARKTPISPRWWQSHAVAHDFSNHTLVSPFAIDQPLHSPFSCKSVIL